MIVVFLRVAEILGGPEKGNRIRWSPKKYQHRKSQGFSLSAYMLQSRSEIPLISTSISACSLAYLLTPALFSSSPVSSLELTSICLFYSACPMHFLPFLSHLQLTDPRPTDGGRWFWGDDGIVNCREEGSCFSGLGGGKWLREIALKLGFSWQIVGE